MKRVNLWIAVIVIAMIVMGVIQITAVAFTPSVEAQGQVIHFNGQTLDLSDASNVLIQSSNDVRVFGADKQGGVVTVTTSIVTVTVWMKP